MTSTDVKPLGPRMQTFVEDLQKDICRTLEAYEETVGFQEDVWEHREGGGGRSRVLEAGEVFEKAGVNVSAVTGELPARMAEVLNVAPAPFFATGLSLVIHPRSPFVPSVHANFRYLALGPDPDHPADEWFGGGGDMTPYYPELQDVQHFHRVWREVCRRHPEVADYPLFKTRCDDYFYLPHRQEARGIGGIFYDYMRQHPEEAFAFTTDAGRSFLPAYLPIVDRHAGRTFSERERVFQKMRRGRYVEFNLLYDRGTKFGLETGGRVESILMSLPPSVTWPYRSQVVEGAREERARWFFQPRDWLSLEEADIPPAD